MVPPVVEVSTSSPNEGASPKACVPSGPDRQMQEQPQHGNAADIRACVSTIPDGEMEDQPQHGNAAEIRISAPSTTDGEREELLVTHEM